MPDFERRGMEFPDRKLIAFVTRVERIGPEPYGRSSFEFDAIDAETSEEEMERAISVPNITAPFAVLRVVTTEARFHRNYGFLPVEGMWVELSIEPSGKFRGPITFHSQLGPDGYSEHTKGRLSDARLLFRTGEDPKLPVPLGASVANAFSKAAALANLCQFPIDAIGPHYRVRAVLRSLRNVLCICVRDVGQASFVSLLDGNGKPCAHFDAGWPISFNRHTAPKQVPLISGNAPVILSHWDWDHLHAYHRCNGLSATRWLTPIQPLGPGARKVANQLNAAGNLIGYSGPSVIFRDGILVACSGPAGPNDNGLALALKLSSGKLALLVGDASYDSLGHWASIAPFNLLVVTHHGAEFAGGVPLASSVSSDGVVSVGRGNVYKHPRQSALDRHTRAGWQLKQTASAASVPRADRYLGP